MHLKGRYNLTAQQHALSLINRGDYVYYLQSGRHYSTSWLFGKSPSPKLTFSDNWNGINCWILWNSINRSPAYFNNQKTITDEKQDELIINWVNKENIDKVFIHSLEGQSLSLIKNLKNKNKNTY